MRRSASFFRTSVEFLLHVLFAIPVSLVLKLFIVFVLMLVGPLSPQPLWVQFQPAWYGWTVWIYGFVLGFLINGRRGQRIACFTWLVGAAWLALGMWVFPTRDLLPTDPRLNEDFLDRVFVYVVFTIPIMNAFSYSIGATLGLALNRFWLSKKEAAA